eukprot:4099423-Amphidinium_carterae.1
MALQYAADELLMDSTFAVDARMNYYMLRLRRLSGDECLIAAWNDWTVGRVLTEWCQRNQQRRLPGMQLACEGDIACFPARRGDRLHPRLQPTTSAELVGTTFSSLR